MSLVVHRGGCHCGCVLFEVDAPEEIEATECNCSLCSKTGFLHLIVPASRFRLLKGKEELVSYRFNTKKAEHLFCKYCGVESFYIPRSNPDGFSVNVRCLDMSTVKHVYFGQFDGKNWEEHGEELKHLSEG